MILINATYLLTYSLPGQRVLEFLLNTFSKLLMSASVYDIRPSHCVLNFCHLTTQEPLGLAVEAFFCYISDS